MDANQLIDAITPEAYERLVFAVETGKWPEGTPLSPDVICENTTASPGLRFTAIGKDVSVP